MVNFRRLFGGGGGRNRDRDMDVRRHLLPHHANDDIPSAIDPKRVTHVAMRLKYLVEQVIPCELKESQITRPHSAVITPKVVELAKNAGDHEDRACVIYCLLVCTRWFKRQALKELYDADLDMLRAEACQVIAKRIIEETEDQEYLFQELLVKRYRHLMSGEETTPTSAIERSVDLHAVRIIGSSGYQKCIKYLWRGWMIQDDKDPTQFMFYKHLANTDFWVHFHPDRMRAPIYQNCFQILISFIYLVLYTIAINTVNPDADIDAIEGILYIFTLGFIMDEFTKFWKVGRYYLGFWNVFNSTLYAVLVVSFGVRCAALSKPKGSDDRTELNILSYNFFAFVAPMFWCRILLYLDSFRTFGAMLVILKQMMAESFMFFLLLGFVVIGFLQAFIGMDQTDSRKTPPVTSFILQAMANAVLQSPDFDGFDKFSPPFGLILYYIFTFVIMILLLNILIALFNSAYEDITGNAIDEYMALFAQKTMQFVRPPDENVFLAPLNLIEITCLSLPFEWWMNRKRYAKINDYVMWVVYSPLLLIVAWFDARSAAHVRRNRANNQPDDDEREEWEELDETPDFRRTDWVEKVDGAKPNVEEDFDIQEINKLRVEIEELRKLLKKEGVEPPKEDGVKPDEADKKPDDPAREGEGGGGGGGDGGAGGAPDVGDD